MIYWAGNRYPACVHSFLELSHFLSLSSSMKLFMSRGVMAGNRILVSKFSWCLTLNVLKQLYATVPRCSSRSVKDSFLVDLYAFKEVKNKNCPSMLSLRSQTRSSNQPICES